jgi:hypothetical protein
MTIRGIYGDEWQKFHPDQFVCIWQFDCSNGLEYYCDGKAGDIPVILGGESLEDFVLEPVNDMGEAMTMADAIERKEKL